MKLLGREISGAALLDELEARLRARGLTGPAPERTAEAEGVAPPVDPLRFNLRALEEHADPTRPVPLHTHRGGVSGRLVLLSKGLARRGGRWLLASALERQRVFNGHVRDSYAQLAAEILRLTAQVDRLSARLDAASEGAPGGPDALPAPERTRKAATPREVAGASGLKASTSRATRAPAKRSGVKTKPASPGRPSAKRPRRR